MKVKELNYRIGYVDNTIKMLQTRADDDGQVVLTIMQASRIIDFLQDYKHVLENFEVNEDNKIDLKN